MGAAARDRPDVLVITGPTAVGKTRLAVAVAHRLDGEVISMDSRQVYRGMDIGTAKPTLAERQGIPHHGFDLVAPDERYSAGRFARDALGWIAAIRTRRRVPILAGGTGFFLRALTDPLFEEPPFDEDRRARLRAFLAGLDAPTLSDWVRAIEPAQGGSGGGRQRLTRRLEVALLTGRPLSWWHARSGTPVSSVQPVVFVLELPGSELVRRIDERVVDMVRRGLTNEVRRLARQGHSSADPGMNATGYAEFLPCLTGERTAAEAVRLTQAATRRYARRQRTWFRNQLPPGSTRLDAARPLDELVSEIERTWKERQP